MSDSDHHPDLAELDAARTGEATFATREHVERCDGCRRTLADLAAFADTVRISTPPVPDAVEQRILWTARKEAARTRRATWRRRLVAPAIRRGFAVAAGVLLALGILRAVAPWRTPQAGPALADVDENGVVDIRDAFLIARTVGTDDAPARLDVNHDRVVDQADVEVAARAAVALGEPS